MSNEEGKTIIFGDKEYEVDKLSDQAKMIVSELEFLNPQLEQTNQMMVELQGASQHLTKRLGTEIGHFNDNETDNNQSEDAGD
jgi:hypothetical protein